MSTICTVPDKKNKKKTRISTESLPEVIEIEDDVQPSDSCTVPVKKKKKKNRISTESLPEVTEIKDDVHQQASCTVPVKKKKKKKVQQTKNEEDGEIVETELVKEVEDCDFIILDSVGCTDENTRVEYLNSTQDSQDDPQVVFTKDESGLFCLDTTPQTEPGKEKTLGPRFRRDFDEPLQYEKDSSDEDETITRDKCFNCQGSHSLSECTQPKNYQVIAKNRAVFNQNQPKLKKRYHVDDKPGKFRKFKPGVISKNLQKALGLRSSEVPWHIYQMRLLGYPPGWIEDITEYSSGLDFIDTPNSPSFGYSEKVTFDLSRIIDFPGFNCRLPNHYKDDCRYLNFPPMQDCHSKKALIKQLKTKMKQSKKRFRSELNSRAEAIPEVVDLDKSIEDLEEHRKKLLAKLQEDVVDRSTHSNEPEVEEESIDIPGETPSEEAKLVKEQLMDVPKTSTSHISSQPDIKDAVPSSSPKQSKLLAMGTPVSIRYSPYNRLPNLDKFATNMGDLELFENLPNSTGAFQKIKSLLSKVRNAFNKKK